MMVTEGKIAGRGARKRALRGVSRASRARGVLGVGVRWATIILLLVFYLVYAVTLAIDCELITRHWGLEAALSFECLVFSGRWAVACMMVAPVWAGMLALLPSSLAVGTERERGTLEALRLTGLPARGVIWALMRRRLGFALLFMLLCLPLYLVPQGLLPLSGEMVEPWYLVRTCFASTFGRFFVGAQAAVAGGLWGCTPPVASLLSGPPAWLVDATRVYALAAIGAAVSACARSTPRAVFWSVLWALIFLLVTVACEWVGALAVSPFVRHRTAEAAAYLLLSVVLLESGLGNLLVPGLILRLSARRLER